MNKGHNSRQRAAKDRDSTAGTTRAAAAPMRCHGMPLAVCWSSSSVAFARSPGVSMWLGGYGGQNTQQVSPRREERGGWCASAVVVPQTHPGSTALTLTRYCPSSCARFGTTWLRAALTLESATRERRLGRLVWAVRGSSHTQAASQAAPYTRCGRCWQTAT